MTQMVVLVVSIGAASNASGQAASGRSVFQAATCGWSLLDTNVGPMVLTLIEDRIRQNTGYSAETAQAGMSELRRWVHDCNATASRQAVLELQRAYERGRSDPALNAALAIALSRGIEVQPPNAHGYNFRPAYGSSNAERQARRLFVEALKDWPLPELGEEFASIALATRDANTLDMASEALEALTLRVPGSARLWTAQAEVAIAQGNYDEAIEAASNGAGLGDRSGLHALGVARLLAESTPVEGGRIYLEGLATADESALYRYHEDLAPLLSLAEEVEWARQPISNRRQWIAGKWEWRASTSARTVAERLAVHFARLDTAITHYRRLAHRGARPADAIVWDSAQLRFPFDDRGLILIRHGGPDDIIRAPSGRAGPAREAWIYYSLNGGRSVFEFQKLKDWADWVLTPPGGCDPFLYMYGYGGPVGEAKYLADEVPNANWLADFERSVLDYSLRLAVVDPASALYAARCMGIVVTAARENRVLQGLPRRPGEYPSDVLRREMPYLRLIEVTRRHDAVRQAADALATETATPRFADFVPALSSVYAFKGPDSTSTLAAFLAIPGEKLTPRPIFGGVIYPLRLTLAVEDPITQRVQRRDTSLAYRSVDALVSGQQLRTHLQMSATAVSDATLRITVVNPDHTSEGQVLVGSRSVPVFASGRLSMSDLVIAEPGPGTWRRGDVAINPIVGHQLPADTPFQLFYEVYGLGEHAAIRTRIIVAPSTDNDLLGRLRAFLGNRRILELSFEETAEPGSDGVFQVTRTITPSLEPGRYELQVTVEDPATDQVVIMRTHILLIDL